MKKSDILKLNKSLNNVKNFGSVKFKYSIIKNINIIKSETDSLLTIQKEINSILQPFEIDRENLIRTIGSENPLTGEISISVEDTEKIKEYNAGVRLLSEKHKDIIKTYTDKINEFNIILDEEIEGFEFFKISIDNCPDDVSGDDLDLFMIMGIVE